MADIRKDNVEIYIRELILKEIRPNSNEKKIFWDMRKQGKALWPTKEKDIKANEKDGKVLRTL